MKDFSNSIVIGLECHVELNTNTKLFCSCPAKGSEEPNTRTCPTCLGMPGSKPVLNKKAVEFALKLCLALNCKISPELIFSRKSYFYPDMAKNFQISQYEIPLGKEGKLNLSNGKEIGITRVHMEEDPASLVHPSGMQKSAYVLVDYNRSGNPLLEIVTKPELSSAAEARDFMKQLINVLNYLEIFDENYNIIKADANISIRESGFVKDDVALDPFSRDGVVSIEAAFYAAGFPVNYYKKDKFAFLKLKIGVDFEKFFEGVDKSIKKPKAEIYSYDHLFKYVDYSRKNAKIAGVDKHINFSRVELEWLDIKFKKESVDRIITNPPTSKNANLEKVYGEFFYQCDYILKNNGTVAIVSRIPDFVKKHAEKRDFAVHREKEVWSGEQLLKIMVFKKKNI